MIEALGWIISIILVLTLGKQVYKQWQEGVSEGISRWLFIGQITASTGFSIYSWLVHNRVFVVTNLLMILNAFIGLSLVLWQRHHKQK